VATGLQRLPIESDQQRNFLGPPLKTFHHRCRGNRFAPSSSYFKRRIATAHHL